MLLAIDSGNTNIVFAVYEGENLKGEWRASSDAKRTADEYGVWLTHLMALDDTNRRSEYPTKVFLFLPRQLAKSTLPITIGASLCPLSRRR